MNDSDAVTCPLCNSAVHYLDERMGSAPKGGPLPRTLVACEQCGSYSLEGMHRHDVRAVLIDFDRPARNVSHQLARAWLLRHNSPPSAATEGFEWDSPRLDPDQLRRLASSKLPSPLEQVDYLVDLVGRLSSGFGYRISLAQSDTSVIGASHPSELVYVGRAAKELGWAETSETSGGARVRLTAQGWKRFEELQAKESASRRIFIAMKFGDEYLDELVQNHMRPAVEQCGFELHRLDWEPSAGLIDDRLRTEIRRSRMLLAELTHGNQGAYWEAGYAEALGKPVVVVCEQGCLDPASTNRLHFDTNHMQAVPWSEGMESEFCEALKATIRATLPAEAKMIDD